VTAGPPLNGLGASLPRSSRRPQLELVQPVKPVFGVATGCPEKLNLT